MERIQAANSLALQRFTTFLRAVMVWACECCGVELELANESLSSGKGTRRAATLASELAKTQGPLAVQRPH